MEKLVDSSCGGLVEAGAVNQLIDGGPGDIFQVTAPIQ